ncbi:APC family permease [Rhodococcus sp. H29-C3]|uniref:APC family permease n=1 Tax=Rhodococcus sp. H29-C3 TaxID=3046307 RepID=UPI0024BABDC5|nr:APC family permease [Rhodococcus sp. H29-C3]MDJ0361091.1 APC family permease [Rhodococcus sp. H29-C3]
MTGQPTLPRTLGLTDAVMIGLGSMIGAGIFVSFTPAAATAGAGLLIGLAIAAVVAVCNATSSAQLAAQYPTSGGSYIYGRQQLSHWAGFLAGWSFVIGKTASCAAMALTFATYAAPLGYAKPVAVAAILALAAVNYFGVTRTAGLTKIIVIIVLVVLSVTVIIGLTGPQSASTSFGDNLFGQGLYGILQSAGLLFFAFAGYARIATMGEEVTEPKRTIPRAILTALSITLAIYAVVAVAVLVVIGPEKLATSTAPLVELVTASGQSWAIPLVRVGAATAALGALLALIAGVGRTSLAMARHRDLPRFFAAVHPKYGVPHHAEIALAVVVSILVVTVDLRSAIGFSSFGVLLYYLIANLSALTQKPENRRYPRIVQLLGIAGCFVLVVTLPISAIATGVLVLIVGIIYRTVLTRRFDISTPHPSD